MIKSTDQNSNRRVVVTGLGVVSSLGIGWQEFWKNLLAGKSGISKITAFDTSKYDRHYGGEVKNFDPLRFMSKKRVATIGRSSQIAIAAAKLTLSDAQISLSKINKGNVAVCIGTTGGERRLIELYNRDRILNKGKILAKDRFPACATENLVSSTACAAGNYAISKGFDLIRTGRFDYALVGGADGFSQMVYTGFCRLNAVAPGKCQPFDKNRQGMIPGEGAGMLMLERSEE